ncbi:hypothetical protein M8818_001734 [Zalaria obscura]|uniref:Uncharacterized protein n=1 Tax=Zalaria obscura TaxID=2024903 RepID=A0ACC3SJM7_9PEZI
MHATTGMHAHAASRGRVVSIPALSHLLVMPTQHRDIDSAFEVPILVLAARSTVPTPKARLQYSETKRPPVQC